MKIVVLDGYELNPGDLSWDALSALGELCVYGDKPADSREAAERIGAAEIVFTNKTPVTRELLALCPDVKYIGVLATGYNIVDTAACREAGVTVTNVPSYATTAVAQFTMALLLEICHHAGRHSEAVKAGAWEKCGHFCFWDSPLIELEGKTFGVIGMGRIGTVTARLAQAFGMKVVSFSRRPADISGVEAVTLEELFARSDVVSLHCPLNAQTEKIINAANIAKMKPGVIILNTGRGALVDEAALAQALESGRVFAAGLDVVSEEPIKGDNPLLKAPNCIITPHIAWATKAGRERLMSTAVENLKCYLSGQPVNTVM